MKKEFFKTYHADELFAFITKNAPRNNPGAVLMAIDSYAKNHKKMMHIQQEVRAVLQSILGPQTRTILELGAYTGFSALFMHQLAPLAHIYSAEISRPLYTFCTNIAAYAGTSDAITFFRGDAIPIHLEKIPSFDVVLIDHDKRLYKRDIMALKQKKRIQPGAWIIIDNIGMPVLRRFRWWIRFCPWLKIEQKQQNVWLLRVL